MFLRRLPRRSYYPLITALRASINQCVTIKGVLKQYKPHAGEEGEASHPSTTTTDGGGSKPRVTK